MKSNEAGQIGFILLHPKPQGCLNVPWGKNLRQLLTVLLNWHDREQGGSASVFAKRQNTCEGQRNSHLRWAPFFFRCAPGKRINATTEGAKVHCRPHGCGFGVWPLRRVCDAARIAGSRSCSPISCAVFISSLPPVFHSLGKRRSAARWYAFPGQSDHFEKASGQGRSLAREFEKGSLHGLGLGHT
ncbi:MAG TPA: hypothetical protein VJ801_19475 [Polyangia bacterium]|nr:hypothetical protein [Polyangia bacterium]